ncbi:MAG: hypothetical protein AAGA48_09355 [Myxococcota bacterium]
MVPLFTLFGPFFAEALRDAFGAHRDLVLVETRGSRYRSAPLACDPLLDAVTVSHSKSVAFGLPSPFR